MLIENRKAASRRFADIPIYWSGVGKRSSVLPLPAPAKQTHRAEAGGEER